MSESHPPSAPQPAVGDRLANFALRVFRILVRLLLVGILGVLLGLSIYFGIPSLYRQYIQPIEQNIAYLNTSQSQLVAENEQLQTRLDDLTVRIEGLERLSDNQKQMVDTLESEIADLLDAQQSLDEFRSTAENEFANSAQDVADLQAAIEATSQRLDALEKSLDDTLNDILRLSQQPAGEDTVLTNLQQQVEIIKAMELLTRSRLFLVQNNLGIAQQDIEAARTILAALETEAPDYQKTAIANVTSRLENALENLPERPILAAEELEIAWQTLLEGLPASPPPTATPTPSIEVTTSPTPTPTTTP